MFKHSHTHTLIPTYIHILYIYKYIEHSYNTVSQYAIKKINGKKKNENDRLHNLYLFVFVY